MVSTIGELCTNKNFIIKLAVLACGITVIFLDWPALDKLVGGTELSSVMVIGALVITYMFFESTSITEALLSAAALVQLIEGTAACVFMRKQLNSNMLHLHFSLNGIAIVLIILDIILLVKNIYTQRGDESNL